MTAALRIPAVVVGALDFPTLGHRFLGAPMQYQPPLDRLAKTHTVPEVVRYGAGSDQFAHLRRPDSAGLVPVVALIHGGWWRRRYRLDVMNAIADDLCERGTAVFNIEYRRVGCVGGGWPGTFDDVAGALQKLAAIAPSRGLDLSRLVVAGHSAGGQLALWWAGQGDRSGLDPLLVISLAGVCDLRQAAALGLSNGAVGRLLGGTGDEILRACSPQELVPLRVPQLLVHGPADDSVPLAMSQAYCLAAQAAGDACELMIPAEADHFDLIDPTAPAWARVAARISEVCRTPSCPT